MATDANGECRVNITGDERSGRDVSQHRGLLRKVRIIPVKAKVVIAACCRKIWEVGVEDPRRIMHATKVALALSLVSLLFLLNPLFVEVGDNAIWAVMTVVVVLEFSAGATLSKGLNRGIGTGVAGFLGFFVCYLSEQVAQGEAIVVGSSMFVIGAIATYARFIPFIKRRYDYGVVVFLLTFSLITVSGYRVQNIFRMAYHRFSTILIGCGVCLVINLLIFPIWAGEDIHNATVKKFQLLAKSLQECVGEYFDGHHDEGNGDESEDFIYERFKSVLDSKATDESWATFASWEPGHGRFRYRHPWKQYVKIGVNLRYLTYSIVALHGCLRSEIRTPHSVRWVLKKPCTKVSEKAVKILGELSSSIQQMRRCDWESMMKELQLAVKDLNTALHDQPKLLLHSTRWPLLEKETKPGKNPEFDCCTKRKVLRRLVSWHGEGDDKKPNHERYSNTFRLCANCSNCVDERAMSRESVEFGEAVPLATFAWIVVEIVARLEHVVKAVEELATLANFKPCKPCPNQQALGPPSSCIANLSLRRPPENHVTSNYAD
ncbi:hypothetical protein SUGI_0425880 [Cryptomeria japonica]|uniref:aluminum-activated malate transporter 14 n=1 Tax=Cryptomeria japonica TaxID=3369 RepID=UPI002408D641|nr:aluminum-activated malate transporter 14 [Cryptomeria japonica]GLJ22629.1 hypothetical protein SUGI_0425880 [Cryptomeria japonica]